MLVSKVLSALIQVADEAEGAVTKNQVLLLGADGLGDVDFTLLGEYNDVISFRKEAGSCEMPMLRT